MLQTQKVRIEEWFETEWQKTPAPVYGSVDIRHAGFKISPVDMNLFPAGFNNLSQIALEHSVDAARLAIETHAPFAKNIMLVPENHTRNALYWESIKRILSILKKADFNVRLGSLLPEVSVLPLTVEPIRREGDRVFLENFTPDLILLNNDLSEATPSILQNIAQPIAPHPSLGWHQRLKSSHFQYYHDVSLEFSKIMNMDPWTISPLFQYCHDVDFSEAEDRLRVAASVEVLFNKIQQKYDEHDIKSTPFVIIKADSGTYGMAVMTVRSLSDIQLLNRKKRTRMSVSKGGQPVRRVLIQEGVDTIESRHQMVSESVLYLWGKSVVGGFYRSHPFRGRDENLNAPGMLFEPLQKTSKEDYLDSVIARLSMLAAAREMV